MPASCDRFFVRSNVSFPHSVTVVGYSTDSYGWDFWTIKNSWGAQWGEGGYFRLARGLGHCGVGSYISQPVCQAGSSRGADGIPGATGVTGPSGAGGAIGTGVSGLTPVALSGIAGIGLGLGAIGTGGIVAGPEECAGLTRCVTASGQCCFLVISVRGLGASPQCPSSC